MSFRVRKSYTLFPGVKINLGKRGVSTSVNVGGITLNLSKRGVRASGTIPGTGLSYSKTFSGKPSPQAKQRTSARASHQAESVSIPFEPTHAIVSGEIEELSSDTLAPLIELVSEVLTQRRDIQRDLDQATSDKVRALNEHDRLSDSFFRFFYRKKLKALDEHIAFAEEAIQALSTELDKSHIPLSVDLSPEASEAFDSLVKEFSALCQCDKLWDLTARRETSAHERTNAAESVNREEVSFSRKPNPLIRFEGACLSFGNANGEDFHIYPGVVVMAPSDERFALIDVRDLTVTFKAVNAGEPVRAPKDAEIVGTTWLKVNKDGSPDKRFKGNQQLPICRYGHLCFKSESGLNEEYLISNVAKAEAFANAFQVYQATLLSDSDLDEKATDTSEETSIAFPSI